MEKVVLKRELRALQAKVEDLQRLVVEDSLTNQRPRTRKKMTKTVSEHWQEKIINEVRRNDGISREELIRNILPYAKKGKGMYQKLYWHISNMLRDGRLFRKGRGLTIHLVKQWKA